MEKVLNLIAQNPSFVAYLFALINAAWLLFVYIGRKKHDKELIFVKQSADLDLERRKKVFEMKVSQYEDYFRHIDVVHHRHNTDYQDVFMPIFDQFLEDYLSAGDDQEAAKMAITRFSEQVSKISRDGMRELAIIESETNTLRLTASDKVASLLDQIKIVYSELFAASGKMLSDLVKVTINNDQELAASHQRELYRLGEQAKKISTELREQMRCDLKEI